MQAEYEDRHLTPVCLGGPPSALLVGRGPHVGKYLLIPVVPVSVAEFANVALVDVPS